MQNTVELPEPIYGRTEHAARVRGISVDALISDLLERELADVPPSPNPHHVKLPILHSKHPGTLDLSNFDFDALLA